MLNNGLNVLTTQVSARFTGLLRSVSKTWSKVGLGSFMIPGASDLTQKKPLLQPFIQTADAAELTHATLLSDLCNAVYDTASLTDVSMNERYKLRLVATSRTKASVPEDDDLASRTSSHDGASTSGQDRRMPHVQLTLTPDKAYSSFSMTKANPAMTKPHTVVSVSTLSADGKPQTMVTTSIDEDHILPMQIGPMSIPQQASADLAPAAAPADLTKSPSEWLVADDTTTKTRYIAIQGSCTMEHWQINFTFDPVTFEDPSLGAMVHRGVYQAALKLYDELLPLVTEHVASSPAANVCFTGHSLGGSLATVLTMLFVHRGVLPPSALAPCYTFGAPAVFCGLASQGNAAGNAAHPCDTCQLTCEMRHAASAHSKHHGLLRALGLTEDHMVNVMLHMDIVPRLFACDFTMVADLLKNWMPTFHNHDNITSNRQHKTLYSFVGRVAILRPADDADFVKNDAHHHMLPEVAGLYKLSDPNGSADLDDEDIFGDDETVLARPEPSKKGSAAAAGSTAGQLRSAMLQFMNYPHPLATLTSLHAYGHDGAVSRYHNPDNYTKTLRGLVPAPEPSSVSMLSSFFSGSMSLSKRMASLRPYLREACRRSLLLATGQTSKA